MPAKHPGTEIATDLPYTTSEEDALRDLAKRHICFVLVEFISPEAFKLPTATGSVAELSIDEPAPYKQLMDAIIAKHGSGVKLGCAEGPASTRYIGSTRLMSYSFIHPVFPKALALLPSISTVELREAG